MRYEHHLQVRIKVRLRFGSRSGPFPGPNPGPTQIRSGTRSGSRLYRSKAKREVIYTYVLEFVETSDKVGLSIGGRRVVGDGRQDDLCRRRRKRSRLSNF